MWNSSLRDLSSDGYFYMKTNRSTEKRKNRRRKHREEEKKKKTSHRRSDRPLALDCPPRLLCSSSFFSNQIVFFGAAPDHSVLLPSSPTRSSSSVLRSSGFVFLQVVAFFRFCFSSSSTKIEFVRLGFGFQNSSLTDLRSMWLNCHMAAVELEFEGVDFRHRS